jgi:hypothetical protein
MSEDRIDSCAGLPVLDGDEIGVDVPSIRRGWSSGAARSLCKVLTSVTYRETRGLRRRPPNPNRQRSPNSGPTNKSLLIRSRHPRVRDHLQVCITVITRMPYSTCASKGLGSVLFAADPGESGRMPTRVSVAQKCLQGGLQSSWVASTLRHANAKLGPGVHPIRGPMRNFSEAARSHAAPIRTC